MDRINDIKGDGEYSITDLRVFQTPNFNGTFPKGFSRNDSESSESQENVSRTSSGFSDHFKKYSPKFQSPSIEKHEDERVETGRCNCLIL